MEWAGGVMHRDEEKTMIRAVIPVSLKSQFEAAAKANDRVPSQVLRDLIREYISFHERGVAWNPGASMKTGRKK